MSADPRIAPVLQLLQRQRAANLHSGAAIYISHRGQPIVDEAIPDIVPNQVLPWRSAGKPITAIAIAQLWQRGLLDLDDPVAKHLPQFATHNKDRITLRHLLTHTAGVRWAAIEKGLSWDQIIERVCDAPLEPNWPIGQKAGYHTHTSWFILGEIVHRLSGQPFHEYTRDQIFSPLAMTTAHFAADEAYSPGAAARGTARDLATCYQMLLNRGQPLLRPQTVEALTARHRVGLYDHTFKHTIDWGLGFIINSNHYGDDSLPYGYGRFASPRTFGHGGRQCCTGFADPQHQLAIALIFNDAPGEAAHDRRMREVLDAIYLALGLASEPQQ